MLSSVINTALRAMRKRPGYTFLNGFGLALGLACFLLIGVFVTGELSFDRHHDAADRIVRIGLSGYPPSGGGDHFALISPPPGRIIREEFSSVEALVRFRPATPSVNVDTETFTFDGVWISEPDVFDVFTMPILDGSTEDVLREPATAVVSQETATQLFGDERAVGQYVMVDDTLQVRISGVMADQPRTSHMDPKMLISWSTYEDGVPEDAWLALGYYAYAKLNPGVSVSGFQDEIGNLVNDRNAEQMAAIGFRAELVVEPLTDIYLRSTRSAQLGPVGDETRVWIFAAVALFVLLLAVINFMNLATARSMERAREVGIRKVVGSSRGALIGQFLGESILLALIAFALSMGLIAAGYPVLNQLAGTDLVAADFFAVGPLASLLGVALFAGILGGLYPAVVMSGFDSISVMKGSFHASGRGAILRKSLVSFQFAISIALLACTAVVMRQLDYMQSQDLGFNEEQMLVVDLENIPGGQIASQGETIKDAFLSISGVTGASTSGTIPGRGTGRLLFNAEGIEADDIRSANFMATGYDFLDNYGIDVIAGRGFSPEFAADQQESVIINRTTVDYLGFGTPEDALGKWISIGQGQRSIVGVIEDYHHQSLREEVEPLLMVPMPQAMAFVSLRLASGDVRSTVQAVEATWAELFPSATLTTFFLDDDYNQQYQGEEQLRALFSAFAFLAILIACLGLIGLAAFTAQQRTKEIGVRKVLGASVPGIVTLLSREFAALVGVGFVLAVPGAVYAMTKWLDTFPYHTNLGVMPFAVAGLGALLIALLSVGYQSFRAASADPVRSLRSE